MTRTAQVSAVLVAPNPDSLLAERRDSADVRLGGFAGDRHSGMTCKAGGSPYYPRGTPIHNARQVSIVAEEELAQIAAAMSIPYVLPEWLGANLLVRGLPDLTRVTPTSLFLFPDNAVITIYMANEPCRAPGRVIQSAFPDREELEQGFVRAAKDLRGLLGWVERAGTIRVGDEVRVEIAEFAPYPVA